MRRRIRLRRTADLYIFLLTTTANRGYFRRGLAMYFTVKQRERIALPLR